MGTSSKATKKGDLMPGTSTNSFWAKPAAFLGKRSLHHLGLSAEQTNREGEPSQWGENRCISEGSSNENRGEKQGAEQGPMRHTTRDGESGP